MTSNHSASCCDFLQHTIFNKQLDDTHSATKTKAYKCNCIGTQILKSDYMIHLQVIPSFMDIYIIYDGKVFFFKLRYAIDFVLDFVYKLFLDTVMQSSLEMYHSNNIFVHARFMVILRFWVYTECIKVICF